MVTISDLPVLKKKKPTPRDCIIVLIMIDKSMKKTKVLVIGDAHD